jgi:hypothetical protein
MITVEPLTEQERAAHRCAYCGKGLLPKGWGTSKLLTNQYNGLTCEEQLAEFRTNRRVIAVRKSWHPQRDDDDKVIGRKCWNIIITFMPDNASGWGYDGLFCKGPCAQAFAHASHRAGYRMKAKEPAKV